MVQGSGSKHHARDARDEITQSRIDKARRRRATRKDDDSDSSDEDQEYDGELRGADCLSYKIREAMPPKKFKPTPTDAAKYDGQQEPRSWIDDYLQTVILHKGNQIAAMQCLQLYLKDSARAWLRGLPKGSIKSWDDLVDAFVANFQATYKRPVGIEELRNCRQKQKESMPGLMVRITYEGHDSVVMTKTMTSRSTVGWPKDRHKRRKTATDDNNLAPQDSDRQDERDDRHDGNRITLETVVIINHDSRGLPNYPTLNRSTPPVTYIRMSIPRTAKRSQVTCSGTVGSSLTCTNSSSSQASNSYHHHPHLHRSIKSSKLNPINPTRRFHHHVGG
ncbi:hypothetical protein QYE76_040481 [Lolium multiflorum]|uniref:Retrotransposon gag domain-containing protein n=1 Tax=Lolium multiflorum TaxID=4521 RepID=A0AAD8TCV2_LOLMU|nr:hypothetical protein QYE76_040481 [Lolium multiflorum]